MRNSMRSASAAAARAVSCDDLCVCVCASCQAIIRWFVTNTIGFSLYFLSPGITSLRKGTTPTLSAGTPIIDSPAVATSTTVSQPPSVHASASSLSAIPEPVAANAGGGAAEDPFGSAPFSMPATLLERAASLKKTGGNA